MIRFLMLKVFKNKKKLKFYKKKKYKHAFNITAFHGIYFKRNAVKYIKLYL